MRRTPMFAMSVVVAAACGSHPAAGPDTTPKPTGDHAGPMVTPRPAGPYTMTAIALPGGAPDGIFLDYMAFDPSTGFVWVPAGPTGSVDVVDTATGKLTRIEGFKTQEMERRGKKRVVGPSSVTIGNGVVYVGNRGDFTVCRMNETAPAKETCGAPLDAMPDGIAYVASTDEVWVTTPRDKSLRILDGNTLAEKAKLSYEGETEGFAVDNQRGRFYTNLEDKDQTLAIDLHSHATVATWQPGCGEDGPHGLRLDEPDGLLFVACSAKAEVIDAGRDGAVVSSIDTADGADDLDYVDATRTLYIAGQAGATLTIAAVDATGALTLVETVPTKEGGRNGVVDAHGVVYIADGKTSELLVVAPAR